MFSIALEKVRLACGGEFRKVHRVMENFEFVRISPSVKAHGTGFADAQYAGGQERKRGNEEVKKGLGRIHGFSPVVNHKGFSHQLRSDRRSERRFHVHVDDVDPMSGDEHNK